MVPEITDHVQRTHATIRDWTPSRGMIVAWYVIGIGLMLLGIALFAAIYGSTHGDRTAFDGAGTNLFVAIGVTVAAAGALFLLHEAIHGWVMRSYGATPRFGLDRRGLLPTALTCTAVNHRFTKAQFVAIALAPLILVSTAGAVAVAWAPFGGWLVLPLAMHLNGCIGDLWMTALVIAQPRGALIEDRATGARFHYRRRRAT